MESVLLGESGLRVSRLGFGCCPLGQHGWGAVDRAALIAAVRRAADGGVTLFDTADVYGLGASEENLAKALGPRRKDVVIATKFGVRVEGGRTFYDNAPAHMERALLGSLRRLKTDYVDLYQVHYLDGVTPPEDVVEALERWRTRGAIRAYGVCNVRAADLPRLSSCGGRFASVQNACSLVRLGGEADLRAACAALHAAPMTWGSLGQGVLTGAYGADAAFPPDDRRSRASYPHFHGEGLARSQRIVAAMRPIAAAHGVPLSAAALRFLLDRLSGSVVLAGAKRPEQAADNLRADGWNLSAQEIAALIAAVEEPGENRPI